MSAVTDRTPRTAGTLTDRRPVPFDGCSWRAVGLELLTSFRAPVAVAFTVLMPVAMLVVFTNAVGAGLGTDATGVIDGLSVGSCVFGAAMATGSAAAVVGLERGAGWTRRLRLTPLGGRGYVALKLVTALGRSLLTVLVVVAVALALGRTDLTVWQWVATTAIAWLGSAVFGLYGLAVAGLVDGAATMQVLGISITTLAWLGGVFLPTSLMPGPLAALSAWTPVWGVHQLAMLPVTGAPLTWAPLVNLVAWSVVLGVVAVIGYRRGARR